MDILEELLRGNTKKNAASLPPFCFDCQFFGNTESCCLRRRIQHGCLGTTPEHASELKHSTPRNRLQLSGLPDVPSHSAVTPIPMVYERSSGDEWDPSMATPPPSSPSAEHCADRSFLEVSSSPCSSPGARPSLTIRSLVDTDTLWRLATASIDRRTASTKRRTASIERRKKAAKQSECDHTPKRRKASSSPPSKRLNFASVFGVGGEAVPEEGGRSRSMPDLSFGRPVFTPQADSRQTRQLRHLSRIQPTSFQDCSKDLFCDSLTLGRSAISQSSVSLFGQGQDLSRSALEGDANDVDNATAVEPKSNRVSDCGGVTTDEEPILAHTRQRPLSTPADCAQSSTVPRSVFKYTAAATRTSWDTGPSRARDGRSPAPAADDGVHRDSTPQTAGTDLDQQVASKSCQTAQQGSRSEVGAPGLPPVAAPHHHAGQKRKTLLRSGLRKKKARSDPRSDLFGANEGAAKPLVASSTPEVTASSDVRTSIEREEASTRQPTPSSECQQELSAEDPTLLPDGPGGLQEDPSPGVQVPAVGTRRQPSSARRSAVFKAPRKMGEVSQREEMSTRRKLLRGFGVRMDDKDEQQQQQQQPVSKEPAPDCLFQTAGGKSLQSSTAALSAAHPFLQTVEDHMQQADQPSEAPGFTTASGKHLKPSKEALDRAALLLRDDRGDPPFEPKKEGARSTAVSSAGEMCRPSGGFSTAGGRAITVSSDALKRGQALLADCSGGLEGSEMATGFSTAGGKKVTVSCAAVERGQQLLGDVTGDGSRSDLSGDSAASLDLDDGLDFENFAVFTQLPGAASAGVNNRETELNDSVQYDSPFSDMLLPEISTPGTLVATDSAGNHGLECARLAATFPLCSTANSPVSASTRVFGSPPPVSTPGSPDATPFPGLVASTPMPGLAPSTPFPGLVASEFGSPLQSAAAATLVPDSPVSAGRSVVAARPGTPPPATTSSSPEPATPPAEPAGPLAADSSTCSTSPLLSTSDADYLEGLNTQCIQEFDSSQLAVDSAEPAPEPERTAPISATGWLPTVIESTAETTVAGKHRTEHSHTGARGGGGVGWGQSPIEEAHRGARGASKPAALGLQTAGGRAVHVKTSSLEHVRAGQPAAAAERRGSPRSPAAGLGRREAGGEPERSGSLSLDLRTASGKAVPVSGDSLRHVRSSGAWRTDREGPATATTCSSGGGGGRGSASMLQTAGGQAVAVKESSLRHVRSTLGRQSEDGVATAVPLASSAAGRATPPSRGSLPAVFSTAGGRCVGVSEEALTAVRLGGTEERVPPKSADDPTRGASSREDSVTEPAVTEPSRVGRRPEPTQARYAPRFTAHKPSADTRLRPAAAAAALTRSPVPAAASENTPNSRRQGRTQLAQPSQSTVLPARPVLHCTPEAVLSDRRRHSLQPSRLAELSTPPLKAQMKRFVYSVPFKRAVSRTTARPARASLGLSESLSGPPLPAPAVVAGVAGVRTESTTTTATAATTAPVATPPPPPPPSARPPTTAVSSRSKSTAGPRSQPGAAQQQSTSPDSSVQESREDMSLSESQFSMFLDMSQLEDAGEKQKQSKASLDTSKPGEAGEKQKQNRGTVSASQLEEIGEEEEQFTANLPASCPALITTTTTSSSSSSSQTAVGRGGVLTAVGKVSALGTSPLQGVPGLQERPRGGGGGGGGSKRFQPVSRSEPRSKRPRTGVEETLNSTVTDFAGSKAVAGSSGAVRPQQGMLSSLRQTNRRALRPLHSLGAGPRRHTAAQLLALGVPASVLAVTVERAGEYRFPARLHFSAAALQQQGGGRGRPVRIGDGAALHIDGGAGDGCIGAAELDRAFSTTPGVDPRLISAEWFLNHYKWIVWKLAAMEVAFPAQLAGRMLTPNMLMLQLKYRYDIEVDRAHRSALKKIFEHDDSAGKAMVLCVSAVSWEEGPGCRLELTDGWYAVPASLDTLLRGRLGRGDFGIGSKLCLSGAELTGLDNPAPPLEAPKTATLRLHGNSTRRARWNAKLGFLRSPLSFCVPLSSLLPEGGKAVCTTFLIARVYPLIYMERTADGPKVFRSLRAEEQQRRRQEGRRQSLLERVAERETRAFQEELEKEESRTGGGASKRNRRLSSRVVRALDSGEELYGAMQQATDLAGFEEWLTPVQQALLLSYKESVDCRRRQRLQERIQQGLRLAEERGGAGERDVVPLMKATVRDPWSPAHCSDEDAVLCVWRPSGDVQQLIREGAVLRVSHLQASEGRLKDRRRMQLTATKFTRYQEESCSIVCPFTPRHVTALEDICSGCCDGEVDVVGVVSRITSEQAHTSRGITAVDSVLLQDGAEGRGVLVKVWEGLAALGCEDLVRRGAVVSCTNLHLARPTRAPLGSNSGSGGDAPTLYASELSAFSQSPKEPYLKEALSALSRHVTH